MGIDSLPFPTGAGSTLFIFDQCGLISKEYHLEVTLYKALPILCKGWVSLCTQPKLYRQEQWYFVLLSNLRLPANCHLEWWRSQSHPQGGLNYGWKNNTCSSNTYLHIMDQSRSLKEKRKVRLSCVHRNMGICVVDFKVGLKQTFISQVAFCTRMPKTWLAWTSLYLLIWGFIGILRQLQI